MPPNTGTPARITRVANERQDGVHRVRRNQLQPTAVACASVESKTSISETARLVNGPRSEPRTGTLVHCGNARSGLLSIEPSPALR